MMGAARERLLRRAARRGTLRALLLQAASAGRFYRKAKPGSWREDLTPEQVGAVEEATSALIERFYAT